MDLKEIIVTGLGLYRHRDAREAPTQASTNRSASATGALSTE